MKKHFGICMAILILVTSSPSNRAMHLVASAGAFVHHYVHHLTCQNERISLIEFIELHYNNAEHEASDLAAHQNLPFKHDHHQCQHFTAQLAPFLLIELNQLTVLFQNTEIFANTLVVASQQCHSSLSASDIWQPPRV